MELLNTTSKDLPVTVIVPVKNEEANLARCLEQLGRFAECVVIDSGSTDRTQEIAREHGARVVDFQWNGRFPKKRNWFLMNEPIHTPWVFFLDADEYVDDAFCDDLAEATKRDDIDGYWITYNNYFLDRPLRYGLEQRKLALFRAGRALYERIEENQWSSLDMEIHEHPVVEGSVGKITARVDHRDYQGLGHFIAKHRDYALWEARRYALLHPAPENNDRLTPRQRFKYRHLTSWWYPYFYFAYTYVVKLGFLDGSAGLHYAAYKAWYFWTIRLLIRENASSSHP